MRQILIAAAALLAGCSHASQQFAQYEGDALRVGQGGTKTTTSGIDFWTVGTPPRQFRVLGVLTDTRRDQRFSRAAFDDAVAAKVKQLGGDAVIIVDSSSELAGIYNSATATGTGNSAYGSGFAVPISDRTTQMVVIKYVQ